LLLCQAGLLFAEGEGAEVVRVIDGDSIEVKVDEEV